MSLIQKGGTWLREHLGLTMPTRASLPTTEDGEQLFTGEEPGAIEVIQDGAPLSDENPLPGVVSGEVGVIKNPTDVRLYEGELNNTRFSETIAVGQWQEAVISLEVREVLGGANPQLVPEVLVSGGTQQPFVHRRTIIDPLTEGDLVRLTVPTVEGMILGVGVYHCHIPNNLGEYLRVHLWVGGAGTAFDISMWIHLK